MILSISKNNKINLFLIGLIIGAFNSCSHKKIENIKDQEPVETISSFEMGATAPNSKYFLDQTNEYGLFGFKAVHQYITKLSPDSNLDLAILEDFYSAPKFFKFNKIQKRFELQNSPFDELVRASFLNFIDLDHDGIMDVIIGSLNQKTEMTKGPVRLFKGEYRDGFIHFKEMPSLDNNIYPTSNISVLDFDLDGKLDLFLGNWFNYKNGLPEVVPSKLFKGDGFNFSDVSYLLTTELELNKQNKELKNAAPTFGAIICDIDQNGFPDILTNSSNGYYNKLWMNIEKDHQRQFVDVGEVSGYAADEDGSKESRGGNNSFYTACTDYNNDGIVDLALGNLFHSRDPETRDRSAILTGTTNVFPPKFIRTEIYAELKDKSWSVADHRGIFFDYNLDGLEDLIVEDSGFPPNSRLTFYEQQKDHSFEDKSKELGIDIVNPSGIVVADLNNDGLLDLIVGQSDVRSQTTKNRIYVFINQEKRDNKGSVIFHLQSKRANTNNISGSVKFYTNENKYYKNVVYNYGSLPSQNQEGIYFSFDKEMPKEVLVGWVIKNKESSDKIIPTALRYNLSKLNLKGKHTELNLCEDGRVLTSNRNCY